MWATASSQRIPHRQPLLPLSSPGCFPRHPRKHAHLHASSLALLPTPSQRLPAALHPPTPSLALPSLPGRRPALLPSARARRRVARGLRRGCRLSNPFCSPNGARNLGTGVSGDDPPTDDQPKQSPTRRCFTQVSPLCSSRRCSGTIASPGQPARSRAGHTGAPRMVAVPRARRFCHMGKIQSSEKETLLRSRQDPPP